MLRKGSGRFSRSQVIPAMGGDIAAAKAFSRKQAIFNEKSQQYAREGVITTPGYLRLESLAPTTATSVFNFNTLDTSGVKTSTERRLKLADTFTITDISFYLGTGSCTANAPTAAQYASQELNTFPNPQVTAIGASSGLLEAVYNGYLQLRIDTTTFIDSIPMRQFYRVGTSQKGVGSIAANNQPIQANEWPLSMYGRTDLLPTIELNGQANIEWSINLPNGTICSSPTASNFVNMVLVLQGFLNQGAATVQRNIQRGLRKG